ncbi:MAG TPA: HAD-IA family hydrolase [Candidatus Babeliales bacterium]|nr:HAD-IA family hydrolase [Candidatus Babeliales bacterium]
MIFSDKASTRFIFALAATALIIGLFILGGPQNRKAPIFTVRSGTIVEQKPAHIIFDLNGVLFTISKKKALSHIGFSSILSYILSGNSKDSLEERIFLMLHQLHGDDPATFTADDSLIPMHNDRPLPRIMCQWMKGSITGKEIIALLEPHIEKLHTEDFFESNLEKKLVEKVIHIMFNPDIRNDLYEPYKKGVALLQECKEHGHYVYLLSNMDSELIDLLKKQYPEIFALFDDVVISADVNMIKPDTNIYHHAKHKFNVDPNNCYMIDDQLENIIGAQNAGLSGVHFVKAKRARKELIASGVLPTKKQEKAAVQTV